MTVNKVIGIEEAAQAVRSGSSLSIGGFTSQRHPTALLRELIRQGVQDLSVYFHSAGSELDLLIGAGCLKRVEGAYVADGALAPIAPNWRRYVQEGRIEFEDYSNAAMMARFTAGAMGLPFMPTRTMLGSDLLDREAISPETRAQDADLSALKALRMNCPFTGVPTVLVPAIRTDTCLLHVQKASAKGLVRIEGQEFLDVQQALAARQVFVTCEELVDDASLRRAPECNRLPPFVIDAIAVVPFGSHPHSVHNYYDYDPVHLRQYCTAARSDESFRAYLDQYVYGLASHEEYLERVGGAATLNALRADGKCGYSPSLQRVVLESE